MAENTASLNEPPMGPPSAAGPAEASPWMSELGTLLAELEADSAAHVRLPPVVNRQADNQLIQARLGIAGSLYTALRVRHAATAGHALRVALSSSAWALREGVPGEERDVTEVAALLHDVGMIGLPDQILLKPGPLTSEEAQFVERARKMSMEILRSACAHQPLLDVVEHVPAWYDGSQGGGRLVADRIPRGARMIAVVEAFDAMTTDHVFRPAMSQERAVHELFEFAGSQFDPELVPRFAEFLARDQTEIRREVAGRWLRELDPEVVNSYWELGPLPSPRPVCDVDALFQHKLLENMYDAVVFVDAGLRVTLWNRGAERLTGITAASVCQRQWAANLLRLRNEKGDVVGEDDCPVTSSIRSGVQSLRRLTISGRNGQPVSVDSHAIPVSAEDGTTLGVVLLFHDASPETSLEERCQDLHEKATKDPLTQVANRAELDRVQEVFVQHHKQRQVPCSLIMCDLDRFKQVNDVYGHQAGDDCIRSLAKLLRQSCRPGDLVARYGGEEFVVLCADCDNATAARRAEQIRVALSQFPQAELDGRSITASFGVTEIQPGDTPETMLRRVDRALLMAKAKGRNTVVQLGSGCTPEAGAQAPGEKRGWWPWWTASTVTVLQQDLLTAVPIRVAVEKFRGFVADHRAKIASIEGNHVQLEIDDSRSHSLRRRSDRPVTFCLDVRFEEEQVERPSPGGSPGRTASRTKIRAAIAPSKTRDRRRGDVDTRAREVLASFRSYLMATEEGPPASRGVLRRARSFLIPWLTGR